jgi:anti-anti-sigma factor
MPPVHLQIGHQEQENGIVIVTLAGRLMLGPEGAQLEALIRKLLTNGFRKVIFDFGELTHIDSTGIGRCISSLNMVMQANGKLHIAAATGQVREGFRITQLDRVFQFFNDIPAAKAAM